MIKRIQFLPFESEEYPFNIPSIKNTKMLDLSSNITVLVGNNGSGKSTLLQAIAYYSNSINVSKNTLDSEYYTGVINLSKKMRVSYDAKTRDGFFFSGEEFITYINELKNLEHGILSDLAIMAEEYKNKSDYVKGLAFGPLKGELHALKEKYNGELGTKSHGEGFLEFFKARMHKKGVYLLDEPETPLSAVNQYQLLVLITDLVKNGSQVIIATHSPILMSLKGARIYNFDQEIKEIDYDDIESVFFTRHFLNNKDNYLDRL